MLLLLHAALLHRFCFYTFWHFHSYKCINKEINTVVRVDTMILLVKDHAHKEYRIGFT